MPLMQAFVERLNTRFNSTNIDNVDETLLQPGTNVGDAAAGSVAGGGAIRASPIERDYVANNFPDRDLETLRDVLHSAVTENPRVAVQFLWVPGPSYRIEFWHVQGTAGSRDGISVLLHGPTDARIIRQHPSAAAGDPA